MDAPPARAPDYPIDPLFLERWSPRAFDGVPMSTSALLTLLEAARWAPSCYNRQPWRFLYALRDQADWPLFIDLLVPGNQVWAANAGALVFVLAEQQISGDTSDEERVPWPTASFDAGAAWASLALQAIRSGYYAHAMFGFDGGRARDKLGIPDAFSLEAAVALGRIADPEVLPEKLRLREHPSGRRPLSQLAFQGAWPRALPTGTS